MTTNQPSVTFTKLNVTALIAVLVALLALGTLLASGFGYRFQWWQLGTAFLLLRIGAYLGAAALVLGSISAVLCLVRRSARPALLAVIAIVAGAVALGVPYQWLQKARSVPPIHDITTNTVNPPAFVAIAPLRKTAPNPVGYSYEDNAQAQQDAYPDITSLVLEAAPARVYATALAVVHELGWERVAADAGEGRIEATETTRWFGFKDDVVIRIQGNGASTVVDVRSKSRVGKSDVGANAARIRRFRDALTSRL